MSSKSLIFEISSLIITTSLLSIAISVPVETETPISAVTKLTLSLIPSPHIITIPFSFNSFILFDFSSGVTFAITSSMPSSPAIIFAVSSLSPVIITTLIFLFFKSDITSFALSLMTSFTPIKAIKFSFLETNNILLPLFVNSSSSFSFSSFMLLEVINFLLPIKYLFSVASFPSIPNPAIALKSFISKRFKSLLFAKSKIALAIGCSEFFSILAEIRSTSFSLISP